MRTLLFLLATALFLYSPLGPRGRNVLNMALVLSVFRFYGQAVPRRRYR